MSKKLFIILVALATLCFSTAYCVANPTTKNLTVELECNRGSGTGVRIKQGILTANHVVDGVLYVKIVFPNKDTLPGFIVKQDKEVDLALIAPLYRNEQFAVLGNMPEQGAKIYSYGSGAYHSLAYKAGYVSVLEPGLLITSYPFFPGDSGGPVFNERDELIGITRATEGTFLFDVPIPTPTYGQAIDIATIKKFLND